MFGSSRILKYPRKHIFFEHGARDFPIRLPCVCNTVRREVLDENDFRCSVLLAHIHHKAGQVNPSPNTAPAHGIWKYGADAPFKSDFSGRHPWRRGSPRRPARRRTVPRVQSRTRGV